MTYRDILVHVDSTVAGNARLTLAIPLAQRFDARLTGIHVVPEPDVPRLYKPSVVERVAKNYAEMARDAAETTEALFRDCVRNIKVATDYRRAEGDIAEHIQQAARFADLVVIGQSDTENPPGSSQFHLSERVVVGCGAPVLVVPNQFAAQEVGRSMLIGWDGSAVAARAIRDALPFLQHARSVMMITVDPDRAGHVADGLCAPAMVAHLARHGINVAAEELPSRDRDVGKTLRSRAVDLHADMIVMGAYGHMRLMEFIIGGTTSVVLKHMFIPALMSL